MPNPTVPNPATWASGPVLVPALRNDVANAVSFLSGPPLFMGYGTTSQSIPTGPTTPVTLDTEAVDTWGGHTPPNAQYYCEAAGWHMVTAGQQYTYSSGTLKDFSALLQFGNVSTVSLTLQGEQHGGGSGQNPGPCAADLVQLVNVGSDFVQSAARQDSGAAVTMAGNPYMSVRWVCANSGVAGLVVPANPAWPVPPSYVTSAGLNANIRDTIRFLAYPPVFRGYYAGSGNTLASATFPSGATVALDTTSGSTSAGGPAVDNYSGWNAASNYWAAPVAGLYAVYVQIAIASIPATTQLAAGFSVNGTTQWLKACAQATTTAPRSVLASAKIRLNAGDRIQLRGSQGSGSAVAINGSGSSAMFTKMIIFWEAA